MAKYVLPASYKGAIIGTPETMPQNPEGIWYPKPTKVVKPPVDITAPKTFDEYIGQEEAKDLAQMMAGAANKERRALPNIMVVGEYGLGKTTLARLLLGAVGESMRLYDGDSINKGMPEPGTFIIDEIHNLESQTADSLNLLLDNKTHRIIGCTNNPGMLPSAFRSRFKTLQLHSYTINDLTKIIENVVKRKAVVYDTDAIRFIASRSRFNARQAISYLEYMFDYISVNDIKKLTNPVVEKMFKKLGVDEKGLLPRDRQYLEALPKNGRPVGLTYLSAVLGVDGKTIEEEIEPYLLRLSYIDRTQRGRVSLDVV